MRLAAGVAALETTVLVVVVVLQGRPSAGFYAAVLAGRYPLCLLLSRRSAGAFLGLLLYEVAGLMGALVAPDVRPEVRLAAALMSVTVLVLLGASARLFPSPRLPHAEG